MLHVEIGVENKLPCSLMVPIFYSFNNITIIIVHSVKHN